MTARQSPPFGPTGPAKFGPSWFYSFASPALHRATFSPFPNRVKSAGDKKPVRIESDGSFVHIPWFV
jgi:hypothetical protein